MVKTAASKRKDDKSKEMAAFGRALYSLRIQNGLSQEELAFESDIDRSYVSMLERGEKEPCLVVLFKLSRALKTSLPDIFTLTERLYKDGYKPTAHNARVR